MAEFILISSSHISGEEATTAQLTPPTRKTTGNFTSGKITENTNPTGNIDVGNYGYTEVEWCIQATADADDDASYEFRVVEGSGTAFSLYYSPHSLYMNDPVPVWSIPGAFIMSETSNITDNGNTTAQLTAPSGKTTSNFTAGKIVDKSNPASLVKVGYNGYTEIEWAVEATTKAESSADYEFRVTDRSLTLNTYTVTPEWTIAAAVAGTNTKINIGDTWKDVSEMKINIGDAWKSVTKVQINIGDAWKTIFGS
jgi:hypothetical protein